MVFLFLSLERRIVFEQRRERRPSAHAGPSPSGNAQIRVGAAQGLNELLGPVGQPPPVRVPAGRLVVSDRGPVSLGRLALWAVDHGARWRKRYGPLARLNLPVFRAMNPESLALVNHHPGRRRRRSVDRRPRSWFA